MRGLDRGAFHPLIQRPNTGFLPINPAPPEVYPYFPYRGTIPIFVSQDGRVD